MAEIICNKCNHDFDPINHMGISSATAAGAATGAYLGAYFGAGIGIVGAIIGTIPGAIIGGTLMSIGISKFAKCPSCDSIFIRYRESDNCVHK